MKKSDLELRVKAVEKRLSRVEVAIQRISKEFELSHLLESFKAIDPLSYAKDDLDKNIIKLLMEKHVLTTSEIATSLGQNRHIIGKRLKRMEKESLQAGQKWLEFDPKEKDGHFRAWWLLIESKF